MHLVRKQVERLGLGEPTHLFDQVLTVDFLPLWVVQEGHLGREVKSLKLLCARCVDSNSNQTRSAIGAKWYLHFGFSWI